MAYFNPLADFDPEKKAVLMPNRHGLYGGFPRVGILLFLGSYVDKFAEDLGCQIIGFHSTIDREYPIYSIRMNGVEVCFSQANVGAPAAVARMEFMIACGVRKIIATGSCGALVDFPENEFLVPIRALRDEGTSWHYLPPKSSPYIRLDERPIRAIARAMERSNEKYGYVTAWSTDAIYRETERKVSQRKNQGCAVVDMECSALAACARFRGVEFGQILFTADTLAGEKHDDRDWGRGSIESALWLALSAASEMA